MRKTLLARSSPTRVTDEASMIDLPTDGSLPDGVRNDDHLGTLDAVQGAVHPISNGSRAVVRVRYAQCRRWAGSPHTGVASGRAGVWGKAGIPVRARNRLFRPKRSSNFQLRLCISDALRTRGDRHSTSRQADIGFGPAIPLAGDTLKRQNEVGRGERSFDFGKLSP